MGQPSSYRVAGIAIILCLVIAGFITLLSNTPLNHNETARLDQTNIRAPVSSATYAVPANQTIPVTNRIRVLWYDDSNRTYTFHDYDRPDRIDQGTWTDADLPSPEKGTMQKKAAMVRFLEWDGSMERMTGTKYLIDQEIITSILNTYTLVAPSPVVNLTPHITATPSVTQPSTEITPAPGMLIPTCSQPCNPGDGTIQVSFGYISRQNTPVSLMTGEKNRFLPGDPNRGQPTTFLPGVHPDVFTVRFPANGTNIVWDLMGTTVGAGDVPILQAALLAEPMAGYAPLDVRFTDLSIGGTPKNPLIGTWDFGDGMKESGSFTTHRYESPGKYNVSRTVSTTCGSDTSSEIISVHEAAFTIESFPESPRTYRLMDRSTGNPTVWFWDFNDGFSSWEQNPVHTWKSPGTYAIGLTVSGKAGSTTVVKEITIP